jgi:hypothetical protein
MVAVAGDDASMVEDPNEHMLDLDMPLEPRAVLEQGSMAMIQYLPNSHTTEPTHQPLRLAVYLPFPSSKTPGSWKSTPTPTPTQPSFDTPGRAPITPCAAQSVFEAHHQCPDG